MVCRNWRTCYLASRSSFNVLAYQPMVENTLSEPSKENLGGEPPPPPTEISQSRKGEYLKLLEIHNINRIDYNVRKWETLKYFQSIASAFIVGTVVALTAGIDRGLFCNSLAFASAFTLAVATLPSIAIAAALCAISNLKRETALLFAEEAECFKIAKLLELDIDVPPDKRWIPGDTQLLMPKWRRWSYGITTGITTSSDNIDFEKWIELRIAFPLLLDREVSAITAVKTSINAVISNPLMMAVWGLIVVALLAVGAILFLIGLAVVLPILGHATWHLYRKIVES